MTSHSIPSKSAVVLLEDDQPSPDHERMVHRALAVRLAGLLGIPFIPAAEVVPDTANNYYYLPARTLIDHARYRPLGIATIHDLYGGVVARPFMATKAISHGLPPGAPGPEGWTTRFCELAGSALLDGFTVFSLAEARLAGQVMLQRAPLRLKPVRATAGRGQTVITQATELERALALMDPDEVAIWGLVLEENLQSVQTYSVGQVAVADITVSYFGSQQLTLDHMGDSVYGGSELTVTRGGYPQLLGLPMDEATRLAIELAQRYEQAALQSFPELIASRRNYDVARGLNHLGQWRTGVLEQSWRVGGASSAEVLAIEAFANDAALQSVIASTHEVFDDKELPADAVLFYQGDDHEVGLISKYARVRDYEYSK